VKKVKVAQKVAVTYSRPIATDRVDGAITSVCTPPSGFKFKFGTTSVKCKATDAHDNSSTVSFQVRVVSTGLLSPTMGASLTAPPRLAWKATPKATYYNVQLFTAGRKILTVWPSANSIQLKKSWVFAGSRRELKPGVYNWLVWPGFGSLAAAKYGALIGRGTFSIVRK
jgi:hypothetical protein